MDRFSRGAKRNEALIDSNTGKLLKDSVEINVIDGTRKSINLRSLYAALTGITIDERGKVFIEVNFDKVGNVKCYLDVDNNGDIIIKDVIYSGDRNVAAADNVLESIKGKKIIELPEDVRSEISSQTMLKSSVFISRTINQLANFKHAENVKTNHFYKRVMEFVSSHAENHIAFKVLHRILDWIKPGKRSSAFHSNDARRYMEYVIAAADIDAFVEEIRAEMERASDSKKKAKLQSILLELESLLRGEIDSKDKGKAIEPELNKVEAGKSNHGFVTGKGHLHIVLRRYFTAAALVDASGKLVQGTIAGLIQQARASTYIKMVFSVMETLITHYPEQMQALLEDDNLIVLVGVALTIFVLVVFNSDFDHLASKLNKKGLSAVESPMQTLAQVTTGIGLFLSFFGAPFYQGKELVLKIGECIGKYISESAELLWNVIAGFEIPVVEQTVFETVINLVFGGWKDTINGIVIGATTALASQGIEKYLIPCLSHLTVDWLSTNVVS